MKMSELFNHIPADYDSPISIVTQTAESVAKFVDDGVMKAVFNAGFNIDKDKLISILRQGRERYEAAYRKGYSDGYKKREDEIVRCKDCTNGVIYCDNGGIICDHVDSNGNDTHPADWFCADGKRKDEQ